MNRNTAHTARTLSLKARSTSGASLGFWRKFNTRAPWSEAPNVLRCGRFPVVFAFRQLSH